MYTLNKSELRAIVAFCSRDEARHNLTRVAFDNGVIVATDGHRLLKCDVHRDHDAPDAPLWTVPRAALDAARKAAKARDAIQITRIPATDTRDPEWRVEIVRDGAIVSTQTGPIEDAAFPPYQQVIPGEEIDASAGFADGPAAIGVNPAYLADLALVHKATDRINMRMVLRGPLDPIVCTLNDPAGERVHHWTVVTMHVRL